ERYYVPSPYTLKLQADDVTDVARLRVPMRKAADACEEVGVPQGRQDDCMAIARNLNGHSRDEDERFCRQLLRHRIWQHKRDVKWIYKLLEQLWAGKRQVVCQCGFSF